MNVIQAMAKDRTDQATLYRRLLCAPSLESILTTHQTNNTCSDKLGFFFLYKTGVVTPGYKIKDLHIQFTGQTDSKYES